VDVAAILDGLAAKNSEKLDWKRSIVDLMKLVGMNSSLAARKQLAAELHYTGDPNDSASMNIWLHKEVLVKLAENGGKVPSELLAWFSKLEGRSRARMYACTGAVTCFATSGASHFWGCLFVFAHATTIYFGSDSKEIAHRYRLKRIGNPSQFVLLAPYDTGGLIIEEIGWPKPFILARAFGSQ
jgi:hypothetical protein